jgi:hypothetical protein
MFELLSPIDQGGKPGWPQGPGVYWRKSRLSRKKSPAMSIGRGLVRRLCETRKKDAMRTEIEHHTDCDATDAPTSLAGYLLTAERAVMGLVLLGFGVSGCLNLVPDAALPAGAEAVGGVMMQVGFAYPLLKGIEVLLELYISRRKLSTSATDQTRRAAPARPSRAHDLTPTSIILPARATRVPPPRAARRRNAELGAAAHAARSAFSWTRPTRLSSIGA